MTFQSDIVREIERLYVEQPEVLRTCLKIITYLAQKKASEKLHLTYSLLKNETAAETDAHLLLALQYLTGAKADLLNMQYEFLDEDGSFHPIESTVISEAAKTGEFLHPESHEPIADYKNSVLVYFSPSARSREFLLSPDEARG